jgi:hypothetical protein
MGGYIEEAQWRRCKDDDRARCGMLVGKPLPSCGPWEMMQSIEVDGPTNDAMRPHHQLILRAPNRRHGSSLLLQ